MNAGRYVGVEKIKRRDFTACLLWLCLLEMVGIQLWWLLRLLIEVVHFLAGGQEHSRMGAEPLMQACGAPFLGAKS